MWGESSAMSGEQKLSLEACVEGLLFVAGEPVPIERLASILDVDGQQVEEALASLTGLYRTRGLRIQRHGRRVQIVTAPEMAGLVRALLGLDLSGKLSPAALETLAIVAYQQPVTRAQVEAVRGVNSDTVIRTLVNRGLVEEQGRMEQPGRPILYGTTFEFLQQFGLSSLEQLPPLQIEPEDPPARD